MAHPPEMPVRIRRFYARAEVGERDGGFAILLDGRVARTPAGRPLALPTRALAELIGEEWSAQGEDIVLGAMPATRLAQTALDGVADRHAETVREFARFAETDLLCYFAERPESLVRREEATWGPLLAWAELDLGLAFVRTTGISHRSQPPGVLAAVSALAESSDPFSLAGLAFGAALFGSAVIVLALHEGRLDAAGAVFAARLDEAFQEEHWGVDDEAAAAAKRMACDAAMLDLWFRALRDLG